jgi:hypothetical protein
MIDARAATLPLIASGALPGRTPCARIDIGLGKRET